MFITITKVFWVKNRLKNRFSGKKNLKPYFSSHHSAQNLGNYRRRIVCLSRQRIIKLKKKKHLGQTTCYPSRWSKKKIMAIHTGQAAEPFLDLVKKLLIFILNNISFLNLLQRPCLFPGIHFPRNHFPNFPMFVCH